MPQAGAVACHRQELVFEKKRGDQWYCSATCVKLSASSTAVRGSSPAVRGAPDDFLGGITSSVAFGSKAGSF